MSPHRDDRSPPDRVVGSAPPVDLDLRAGVATITFDRGAAHNVLDLDMAVAIGDAVGKVRRAQGVRCVVLRGSGRAFMAGGDVHAFSGGTVEAQAALDAILRHMHPAIVDLRAMDAPVVAAVNGSAAGAGLSLVLAADYVMSKPSSRFVLAYDRLGTVPDCGGTWFLAKRVGRAAALRLMIAGGPLTAAEAAALGIVDEVVAEESFDAAVASMATRIASGPTRALGLFKRLLDDDRPLAAQLEAERLSFSEAMRTADFHEGVAAFVGKRPPVFTGT